jgi:hypothetical protein
MAFYVLNWLYIKKNYHEKPTIPASLMQELLGPRMWIKFSFVIKYLFYVVGLKHRSNHENKQPTNHIIFSNLVSTLKIGINIIKYKKIVHFILLKKENLCWEWTKFNLLCFHCKK